jgi:DNA processing protein
MRALGGWVLTPLDPGYPGTLGAIDTPPLVLFGRGHAEVLAAAPAVAVVGTRSPTPVGRTIAGRVARHLAGAGAVVISGLAIGVDGEAHRATLDAGGRTLAVIGSGPDRPGPAAHRRLAERIVAAGGVVLGELAPGVSATRGTFPRRNRIISGLAGATIVVEAPAQSGALITARHALEQGRKLLVAPGRPFDRRVAGNLALLRETPALPLIGLDELLSDLELENQPPAANVASRDHPIDLGSLGPSERAVAEALREGPGSADQLCQATGRSAAEVAAALMLLQLRGWTRTHGALHLPAGRLLDQARR